MLKMNKLFLAFSYLLISLPLVMIAGQKSAIGLNLPLSNAVDFSRLEITDTLDIEITIQAGATIDSSTAVGSCIGATSYEVEVNSHDSISYQTNQVIITDFGVARAYYSISVSLLTDPGTYSTGVIYTLYRNFNQCQSRLLLFTINVIPPKVPVANFKASPTSIVEGGTIHFTDLSSNVITDWYWDFGDGENSTEVEPSHSYTTSGSYSVSLKVTGPAGSNTKIKQDYINVLPQGTPGTQLWNFQTQWGVQTSPVIDKEGTIYIGSTENYLYAINPDGTEKWRHLASERITYCALGNDETIYISCLNWLAAVDTAGNRLWTYTIFDTSWELAVGVDGIIYIITKDSEETLRAINNEGEMIWSLGLGWATGVPLRVSIAPDGTIYAVGWLSDSQKNRLFAITPEGKIKWTWDFKIPFDRLTKIAIDDDGTIYIGGSGELNAINPDGSEKWTYSDGEGWFQFELTIGLNGNIYAAYGRSIISLKADGKLDWTFEVYQPLSSVTVGADEMLYFTAQEDSNLYALNPDGTLNWKFELEDCCGSLYGYESAPTINEDKTLYVGYGEKLYAVTTTSSGLADSPWPKAGQNYMNTGRKINPAPYLVEPRNDSIQIQDAITLKWISIPGATEYELEIDKNEDFSGSFIYRAKISDTLKLIENLQLYNTYYWHVRVSAPEGLSDWSPTWSFTYGNSTNVLEIDKNDLWLNQNFPNPFAELTIIEFNLPKSEIIRLSIFNLLGREIVLLNDQLPLGIHSVTLNREDLTEGIWFYKIETDGGRIVKKMVVR